MNSRHSAEPLPSVGLDSLDNQHQRLLHLVAQVGRRCQEGAGAGDGYVRKNGEFLHFLTNDLLEAALEHFRCEEELTATLKYPLTEAHRNEHLEFIERLSQFLYAGIPGVINVAELYGYVAGWMDRHERVMDMEYGIFSRGK